MPAVEVKNLSKSFGEVKAVNNISFDVEEGSIFGLLGPNGAGKTTTLRMIYGVLRPDSGSVRVLGIDVWEEPRKAKSLMGVMPEDTGIYPRLTAEENLIYFGKMRGMDEHKLRRRVSELLKILGLEEKRFTIADKLSKGQKQKVAFARAILDEPPILILDEPTLGVDVMSAREIRNMIVDYARAGRTVILSTHNMWEAEKLCTHVGIISEGKMRYVGKREDLEKLYEEKEFEEIFLRMVRGEVIEKVV
ncbi:ABC transporter ATP-binding protein [Candidatus Korarchaeum cryptofilum]|jgi:ABC-type multidrug transport system ATPase subunit|uniref:ABC transporter ATP-binding protein n=1 Tax=Candidatus Korarchaeum cryptofilum TaxID=498846 RepID=A0A3R9QZ59_9CREN|nr:ABC transporter ATP-binding protein [Candidatus Korarchaeum cryptofilum]RSN69546.1 ABC transporter ATP-binding protein [Candidatus Korarchaeum cryptofilum]